MLATTWGLRRTVFRNAVNEVRYRHAGSGLGVFWNVVHPLVQVLVYTGALAGVFAARGLDDARGFALHLSLALFPWLSFSESLARSSQCLVRKAPLLRTLPVPFAAVVAEGALASAFSLLVSLALLAAVAAAEGHPPRAAWMLVPVLALLLHGLAFGIGLGLACLRVLLPDVGEVLRSLLQLWMWTMPVVWPESAVGRPGWLLANPPWVFLRAIRGALLAGHAPSGSDWLLMLAWVALAGMGGLLLARGLESDVKDAL